MNGISKDVKGAGASFPFSFINEKNGSNRTKTAENRRDERKDTRDANLDTG